MVAAKFEFEKVKTRIVGT